jgi:hypothetical protein
MKMKTVICLGISLAILALAGCGGGGGDQTTATPTPTPTSGVLKVSAAGTPNTIGAIDMTINFPGGVKVNTVAATGEAADGVVAASGIAAGSNTLATGKFTPASGSTPAQLRIGLINTAGFGLGEFVTIKFDLETGGSFPASATAFSVAGFAADGLSGAPLSGISVSSITMQ